MQGIDTNHYRRIFKTITVVTSSVVLKYMYIDESGDLGFSSSSSNVLVISALLVDDKSLLDRIIKNMRRNKFRKELKSAMEIKANKSSPDLRKYMIAKLSETPGTVTFHTTLLKKLLTSGYLIDHKEKLYNFIAGKLATNINLYECDLEIRIDKSKGKQLLRDDFNQYFERHLRDNSDIGKVMIHHSLSHSFSGLQFADLLAWSVYQKEERNITEYVELFRFNSEFYTFPIRHERHSQRG